MCNISIDIGNSDIIGFTTSISIFGFESSFLFCRNRHEFKELTTREKSEGIHKLKRDSNKILELFIQMHIPFWSFNFSDFRFLCVPDCHCQFVCFSVTAMPPKIISSVLVCYLTDISYIPRMFNGFIFNRSCRYNNEATLFNLWRFTDHLCSIIGVIGNWM